jgi:hypothetical protein
MFENNQTERYHQVPTPPAFNLMMIEEMEWILVVAGLPTLFAVVDMSIYVMMWKWVVTLTYDIRNGVEELGTIYWFSGTIS